MHSNAGLFRETLGPPGLVVGQRRQARGFTQQRPRRLCVSEAAMPYGGGCDGSSSGSACGGGTAVSAAGTNRSVVQQAVCDTPCATPKERRSGVQWPQKSELYILRSDGYSCTRETVQPSGNLQFSCPSSQQQLLVWKTRPKRVMVLKKLGEELLEECIDVIRYLGEELGMGVVVEPHDYALLEGLGMEWVETYQPEDLPRLHCYVDFIVCLGGDGLLLHAASLFGPALPPIISFKLGSLGFLTTHNYAEYRHTLRNVVYGSRELASCQLMSSEDGAPLRGVHITLRMRLHCEIWRAGQSEAAESFEVLNEVVLSRGANPYLSKIEVYEHDQLITKVQADGVMLATPTGSTAYNVAAGGSMVHPSVPAILFTPICPHSLNFRPVVLPDYVELEMRISPDARCPAVVCFDGRDGRELQQGDSIRVRMSPNPVPTINNADQTTDWFGAIQRCFQWSERVEQLPMNAVMLSQLPSGAAAGAAGGAGGAAAGEGAAAGAAGAAAGGPSSSNGNRSGPPTPSGSGPGLELGPAGSSSSNGGGGSSNGSVGTLASVGSLLSSMDSD